MNNKNPNQKDLQFLRKHINDIERLCCYHKHKEDDFSSFIAKNKIKKSQIYCKKIKGLPLLQSELEEYHKNHQIIEINHDSNGSYYTLYTTRLSKYETLTELIFDVIIYDFSQEFLEAYKELNYFKKTSSKKTLRKNIMTRQELEILKNKEEYIDTFVKPFRQEARVKLYPMAMKILALEEKLENLKKAIKKSKKDRENELQKLTQELTTTQKSYDELLIKGIEKLLPPKFKSLEKFIEDIDKKRILLIEQNTETNS